MWREWVAKSTAGQEELHLVLIEDLSSAANEPACELMVNRHHLSRDREQIAGADFADLAQAQAYCLKEFGVGPGDWLHETALAYTFEFSYTVTNCGVPQPWPVVPPMPESYSAARQLRMRRVKREQG